MSFIKRLVLTLKYRFGNASKLQKIFVIASLVIVAILLTQSPTKDNNNMGDADLTHLKTNPELTQKLVELSSKTKEDTSYKLAAKESQGFFTDISDARWKMMKFKAHAIQPNTRGDPLSEQSYYFHTRPAAWFQNHYEPELACEMERRIGRLGDGGKWVCDPHRISGGKECLVYSVGSNGDASYEAAILADISSKCEVHVFDFGNYAKSVAQQTNHNPNVSYHAWGISNASKGKFKTLKDTVKELGHTGRTIDIFKIDCEGCELDTFESWFEAQVTLKQILVEIHPNAQHLAVGVLRRSTIKLPETVDFFQKLHKQGYAITHKEPNIMYQGNGICVEYNFLLLSPEFWTTT